MMKGGGGERGGGKERHYICYYFDGEVATEILQFWRFSGSECSSIYEGWNFNFGNTPLDWIQELLG